MIVTRTDALNLFPSIIDKCDPECQPTLKNQPSAHKPLNQFLAPLPPTPTHANAQFAPTKRNGDDSDGAHPGQASSPRVLYPTIPTAQRLIFLDFLTLASTGGPRQQATVTVFLNPREPVWHGEPSSPIGTASPPPPYPSLFRVSYPRRSLHLYDNLIRGRMFPEECALLALRPYPRRLYDPCRLHTPPEGNPRRSLSKAP